MTKRINVSVAYALPGDGFWQDMTIEAGMTAGEAIEMSGVLERFEQLDPKALKIGIFTVPARLDKILVEGDRVEIYRDLLVDPKTVPRKAKAKKKI